MVRKRRPGRKRKPAVARHPSGQIVQPPKPQRERDMRAVVREARQRVFDLTEEQAATMHESTELGRLVAIGAINARRWEAAKEYRRAAAAAARATGVPSPTGILARLVAEAGEGTGRAWPALPLDEYSEEYASWCRAAVRTWDRYQTALKRSGDGMALAVVNAVLLSDLPVPAFLGTLRRGLDVIAGAAGIPEQKAA